MIMDQQSVPVKFSDGRVFNAMMMRVFKDARDPDTGQSVRQRGITLYCPNHDQNHCCGDDH